jgi:hypothetical protein
MQGRDALIEGALALDRADMIHNRLGQSDPAADYFRKALARHPSDRVAKQGLARVTEGN